MLRKRDRAREGRGVDGSTEEPPDFAALDPAFASMKQKKRLAPKTQKIDCLAGDLVAKEINYCSKTTQRLQQKINFAIIAQN